MRTSIHSLSAIAFLVVLALPACKADPGSAPANLPISRVTLYTSGVGYFERTGIVDGDASETLLFPVDQVNDVLKSLILLDYGGGDIQPVTYGAQDPLTKQLQAFSVDLSDNPSMSELLNRIRGSAVTVGLSTTDAASYTGTVMGTETHTTILPNNGGTTSEDVLNILTDEGIRAIPLAEVGSLKIADPKLNQEVCDALSTLAEGRDTSKRPIRLSFSGAGRRKVLIGYLTEAPLWQSTYRLVLGDKPLLQGWALVQNTSQEDWNGVDLSLVSGQPISFTQDLYTPLYVTRPAVHPRLRASAGPVTYDSDMNGTTSGRGSAAAGFGGGAGRGGVNAGLPPEIDEVIALQADNSLLVKAQPDAFSRVRELSKQESAVGAQLGQSLFSYRIKTPVSIPRQQSAMIPFISAPVTIHAVSIYNASVNSSHPLSGARLVNNTGLHLMGGPITVFNTEPLSTTNGEPGSEGNVRSTGLDTETGGYVGDALIDDTEPGQTRLISYAVDTAVDATSEPNGDKNEGTLSLSIDNGLLFVDTREGASTRYTFKNNSEKERTIVVEDPYPGADWDLVEPSKATEHTAGVDRFDVDIPAKGSQSLVVTRERTDVANYALVDSNIPTIVQFMQDGKITPSVRDAIHEVIVRRQALAKFDDEIAKCNTDIASISSGQDRIRNNMETLDRSSTLYKRYVGELDQQETQIHSLNDQIAALQADRAKAQEDLSNYVSKLSVASGN